MPNEVKLLPCPFCGSPGIIDIIRARNWWARCGRSCDVNKYGKTRLLTIAAWNARANTRPTTVVTDEVVERTWREGFQSARECLSDDEAFTLTEDVEEDCWRDSKARASMPTVVTGEQPQDLGAIPGSHPADQANLRCLGASRFDSERGA